MSDRATVIANICKSLVSGNNRLAGAIVDEYYPFKVINPGARQYSAQQMTELFVRDGFIDRYRGTRLVYPPTLRLISEELPEQFPYHRNWKMSETHHAFWELTPTVDHILPISLGGRDVAENWASCSMITNSIKANWSLEQLGWKLLPAGTLDRWDGLLFWFVRQMEAKPEHAEKSAYYRRWYAAAKAYAV